jgi:hypothetical protein
MAYLAPWIAIANAIARTDRERTRRQLREESRAAFLKALSQRSLSGSSAAACEELGTNDTFEPTRQREEERRAS